MQGIVFNHHYLMYVDVAFTEYMRLIGLPYPEAFTTEGTDIFMVSAQIDFRTSAGYDDEFRIGVRQLISAQPIFAWRCRSDAAMTC